MSFGDIMKNINWNDVAKDSRSFIRIAKDLNINEKTIRRNLEKLGLKKANTKLSKETKRKMKLAAKSGDKHPNWKGDEVGYNRLHIWISKRKPKPEFCVDCKKEKAIDLANISGKYKRDVNDYKWTCRRCHMVSDGRINNLLKGNPNSIRDSKGKFVCDGKEEK